VRKRRKKKKKSQRRKQKTTSPEIAVHSGLFMYINVWKTLRVDVRSKRERTI
jgi:hypothetical protein